MTRRPTRHIPDAKSVLRSKAHNLRVRAVNLYPPDHGSERQDGYGSHGQFNQSGEMFSSSIPSEVYDDLLEADHIDLIKRVPDPHQVTHRR
jgi:hypothetical protein